MGLQLINFLNSQVLFTYSYATLRGYQNTLIHTSELKTHPTLINRAMNEYKIKCGPLRPIR